MLINHKQTIRHASTVLLAISTALLLAACGAGSSSDSDSDSNQSEKAETEEASKSTTTAAAAPTPSTTATSSPTASSAGSLGKTAWANNCVACHGGDTGKGNNASKTMSAIASNTGGMGILNGKVSATDANNISAYTANPGAY